MAIQFINGNADPTRDQITFYRLYVIRTKCPPQKIIISIIKTRKALARSNHF